jgi:hypothetical protein
MLRNLQLPTHEFERHVLSGQWLRVFILPLRLSFFQPPSAGELKHVSPGGMKPVYRTRSHS